MTTGLIRCHPPAKSTAFKNAGSVTACWTYRVPRRLEGIIGNSGLCLHKEMSEGVNLSTAEDICSAHRQHIQHSSRSQWSSGSTFACGARGPRIESRCGKKACVFARKSLRFAALGTGCTLTAVPRSTQPSTLRGTANEYQPYGWVIIHGDGRMFGL